MRKHSRTFTFSLQLCGFIHYILILYFMEHLSCYNNNVIQLHSLIPCVVTEVLIVTIVLVYKYNISAI